MRYPSLNRLFTFLCFLLPPILGSALSFVWNGGALWCLQEIVRGKRKLSRDRYFIIISLLFYVYIATNILASIYNYRTPYDLFTDLKVFIFALFPFSYSIWCISRKTDIARACIFGCALSCYGGLLLGLYQHYHLNMRAEGGAGNAIVFAQVVALASGISLAGALGIERQRSAFLLGAYLAGLFAMVLSLSRSGWAVFIVETIVILFLYRKAAWRSVSLRVIMGLLAAAAIVYVAGGGIIWTRLHYTLRDWNEVANLNDYNSSLGLRVALWTVGVELIQTHPLIGHSIHATSDLAHDALQRRFGLSMHFSHFHNGVVTLLVQCGAIGTAAVLGVFVTIAVAARRTLRESTDAIERFGGAVLTILFVNYGMNGSVNILIGHDILDATLMIFLIVGLYIAAGTPASSIAREGRLPFSG